MMKQKPESTLDKDEKVVSHEEPDIIEEIVIEELSIDGVCGVY